MSSFSKKYFNKNNPDEFLFLTWETGYKNVKIYWNGNLIGQSATSAPFVKGLVIETDLGKVKVKFTSTRPLMLEVSVNGTGYYPESKLAEKYDLNGVTVMFWSLAGLSVIGTLLIQFITGFNLDHPIFLTQFVFDVVVTVIYFTTAYLLYTGKPWAYFLGTTVFTLTTAITLLSGNIAVTGFGGIIGILIRIIMLIYLFINIGKVIRAMKNPINNEPSDELLDI